MGTSIVKHVIRGEDRYLLWSSIVDAPVTMGMSLTALENYWREEYGKRGLEDLRRRLEHSKTCSVFDLVDGNRAGDGETELTEEQIIAFYFESEMVGAPPMDLPRGTEQS